MRTLSLATLLAGCSPSSSVPPETPIDGDRPTVPATTSTEPAPTLPAGSRCRRDATSVVCDHETTSLVTGVPLRDPREVHWQVPLGDPPERGWPVAVLFQGSFFSAELTWSGAVDDPIGRYAQTGVVEALLDAGFAVLTPEAAYDGSTYWDTNVLPWSLAWETSPDHQLMLALLAGIDDGTFGDLDPARRYAAGISSGGYMTSRMAVSYPGAFRALTIQSASYATCAGFLCAVPPLPDDHPPTLFLHGEADAVVPIDTMWPYAEALLAQGTEVAVTTDGAAGHVWLDAAPTEVLAFFDAH